jgi:predicted DNA-binding protein YlxM (UPF0122 family)
MQYHKDGYNISEIAEIFNVDDSTIYNNLDEIARVNGVTRESLLQNAPYNRVCSPASFRRDKVRAEQLLSDFKALDKDLEKIISSLTEIIKQI